MAKATASATASSGGIGIFGILLVIFVCAKIFGVEPIAHWSWLWVLSPIWIGLSLTIAILFIVLLVAAFIAAGRGA